MTDATFATLVERLRNGHIDRRTFIARAMALGVSLTAIDSCMASARQATPASGERGALALDELGMAGIEHSPDDSKGTVSIYSSWPMTGASERIGGDMVEGVRYALELFGNAAGGFAIEYEALDDGIAANDGAWDADKAVGNATTAINDPDCVAYIAAFNSGASEVAIPVTSEGGLAQISPASSAVALTKDNPANPEGYPDVLYTSGVRNFMRVIPADDIEGSAGANFAFNDLGSRTVYVLHDDETYGHSVATVFRETFEQLGGEVLGFEAFDASATDYGELATGVASLEPDLIYLGAIVNLNASKLLQDLRSLMPADQVAFLGPSGLVNQAFVDDAGDAATSAWLTLGGVPATELQNRGGPGAAWYEAMLDRLGHEPDVYAMFAFECAVCALQAVDAVGDKDRAAILDQMLTTADFRGMLETWSFDANGDTSLTLISLNQVSDGQITFQQVIEPPRF